MTSEVSKERGVWPQNSAELFQFVSPAWPRGSPMTNRQHVNDRRRPAAVTPDIAHSPNSSATTCTESIPQMFAQPDA